MRARALRQRIQRASSGASFSRDLRHRYLLWRHWGSTGADPRWLLCIGLNPSTADARRDDPTIRRCIAFARREGCDGLLVVNLYAWRATRPDDLFRAVDPVGPANDRWIRRAARLAWRCVLCWGGETRADARAATVLADLQRLSRSAAAPTDAGSSSAGLWCFGRTTSGAPRHPLYLRRDAPLEEWAS